MWPDYSDDSYSWWPDYSDDSYSWWRRPPIAEREQTGGTGDYNPPTGDTPQPPGDTPQPPGDTPQPPGDEQTGGGGGQPPYPYDWPYPYGWPPININLPDSGGTQQPRLPEQPQQPREQFNYQMPDYESTLRQRMEQSPQTRVFSFQGQPVNVPTFQPGVNPFTIQGRPGTVPGAYNPSRVYDPYSSFIGAPSGVVPFQNQLLSSVTGALQNPSPYSTYVARQTFDTLRAQMGRGFDDRRQAAIADAARRGVYYGTPLSSGLGRIEEAQSMAESSLVSDILREQARTMGADRASAIGQAAGLQGQLFGHGLATAQFGQTEQNRLLQNLLQTAGFNLQAGQTGFGNQLATAQLGEQFRQGDIASQLAASQFNRQLGLDQFGAGMQAAGLQGQLEQQRYGQEQGTFQTNLGAERQGEEIFRSRLQDLLGFGQQSFENQLRTATYNQGQMAQLEQFLMSLFGGGGVA